MLAVMVVQVFFRNVLNDSIVWAEELSTFMMMWVAFLGDSEMYMGQHRLWTFRICFQMTA
ncbi:MAG: TRAP transporter small permease subunit [Deltaproteobacteria bacterium]|nr:TRAP transporter small permease subunit [Deltaproteobacteria bacterium]